MFICFTRFIFESFKLAKCNGFKYSFAVRAVQEWNSLSAVRTIVSGRSFKFQERTSIQRLFNLVFTILTNTLLCVDKWMSGYS